MKKVLSILLCFILLTATVFSAPANGLAVEIVGGGYAAYVILAAALAAAGYTVATNQVSPEVFAGLLAAPGSELINALIGSTQMYANAKGQVFFNWTAEQWATFTNWVNTSGVVTGSVMTPYPGNIVVNSFNPSLISSYYETFIPSRTGLIGYKLSNSTVLTLSSSSGSSSDGYRQVNINLQNGSFFGPNTAYWSSSYHGSYLFGSPLYAQNGNPRVIIGVGLNAQNQIATVRSEVVKVRTWLQDSLNSVSIYGHTYSMFYENGVIKGSGYGSTFGTIQITGTSAFPDSYDSLIAWFTDCLNTGWLVGDWSGIGHDVVTPGEGNKVSIDAYPDYQVGEGDLSIPDVIDGTIDIPLDRWIDGPIDISQDPVPIDFTDWPDKTIDTSPDDVIPDIRLNPPADVTAPDTPWADEDSYPLDYPIDTTADPLPPGNNPNPDPGQDEKTNRLKLGPLLLSKFPFCLPWDLMHALKVLVAPAEAPAFTVPIVNERFGINTSITIDMSFADTLAKVCRWFFSALWVVILILITSKIIWK